MKPIKRSFNETAFREANRLHNDYKGRTEQVIKASEALNISITEKELLQSSSPYKLVSDRLAVQMGAPEHINGVKYLELTDVDTRELSRVSSLWNEVRGFSEEPSVEKYTLYITDPEEIKKHKELQALCDSLNDLFDRGVLVNKLMIQNAFRLRLRVDRHTTLLTPNI